MIGIVCCSQPYYMYLIAGRWQADAQPVHAIHSPKLYVHRPTPLRERYLRGVHAAMLTSTATVTIHSTYFCSCGWSYQGYICYKQRLQPWIHLMSSAPCVILVASVTNSRHSHVIAATRPMYVLAPSPCCEHRSTHMLFRPVPTHPATSTVRLAP
jgi:hypothetical protein